MAVFRKIRPAILILEVCDRFRKLNAQSDIWQSYIDKIALTIAFWFQKAQLQHWAVQLLQDNTSQEGLDPASGLLISSANTFHMTTSEQITIESTKWTRQHSKRKHDQPRTAMYFILTTNRRPGLLVNTPRYTESMAPDMVEIGKNDGPKTMTSMRLSMAPAWSKGQ